MLESLIFVGYSSQPQAVRYYSESLNCEKEITTEDINATPAPWVNKQCDGKDNLTFILVGYMNEKTYYPMVKQLNKIEFINTLAKEFDVDIDSVIIKIFNGTRADDFYFSCYDNSCYETLIPERVNPD